VCRLRHVITIDDPSSTEPDTTATSSSSFVAPFLRVKSATGCASARPGRLVRAGAEVRLVGLRGDPDGLQPVHLLAVVGEPALSRPVLFWFIFSLARENPRRDELFEESKAKEV